MTRYGAVLSGGGARGAYEAGALAAIVRLTRAEGLDLRFRVLAGTSIGAVHAAWLAAHARSRDYDVGGLLELWTSLSLDEHLHLDLRGLLGLGHWTTPERSVLEARALERLVVDHLDFDAVHRNIHHGIVDALVVSALDIASGHTALFTELAPAADIAAGHDPARVIVRGEIGATHVLSSASIPFLFPARQIGERWYCDGGVRANTPLSAALRVGVDKLVVIPLLADEPDETENALQGFPSAAFLAGKILSALLLDPIEHDLATLRRINELVAVLERKLQAHDLVEIEESLRVSRGAAYRHVETLVVRPSRSLAALGHERVQELASTSTGPLLARIIGKIEHSAEADLASFLLFDGVYAKRLIELGRADVETRRDEVLEFFR